MRQTLDYLRETVSQTAGPYVHIGLAPGAAGFDIYREELGRDIAGPNARGQRIRVEGLVIDGMGSPVKDVLIEVWQANAAGLYENQQPDCQPELNLRGKLRTDRKGGFNFLSVKPGGYALPSDGPVGRLMTALGCPLERPAHVHFRVTAKGHQTLTTHIFDRADPAIDRDAIFGVRPELLADFHAIRTSRGAREHLLDVKLVLCPLEPRQD